MESLASLSFQQFLIDELEIKGKSFHFKHVFFVDTDELEISHFPSENGIQ